MNLRKNRVFKWNKEQEVVFQTLKKRLSAALVLAYPVPRSAFILDTAAIGFAVGGVISQVVDVHEKVVTYNSQTIACQIEIIVLLGGND